MLNIGFKKEQLDRLEYTYKRYEVRAEEVGRLSINLMELRQKSSIQLIEEVELFINNLANTPKELDRTFNSYQASFKTFSEVIDVLRKKAVDADIQTGTGAGASILAGAGVAAFMPTAAMAVATTFGVASTGTAISALSGAAATNAALAWLGGGALAAGGGGMASGTALLTMAGPIGWAVGAFMLASTGVYSYSKNKKIAEEAIEKRKNIEKLDRSLQIASTDIKELIKLTNLHLTGIKDLLVQLKQIPVNDYSQFTLAQKELVGSLINHMSSLAVLLNKKVSS